MGEDLEAAVAVALGVDGDDDALIAEFQGRLTDEFWPVDSGGVNGNLVGAGQKQLANVFDHPDATAHRQGHEAMFRRIADHVIDDIAVVRGCGDIQECQLIRAGLVVDLGLFHWVTGIYQINEVDALDHSSILDIETGNDALGQHV